MLFFLLLVLLVIWVWAYQFAFLMSLTDAELGAKNDKIIWAVAFILLPPFAPFAFIFWRRAKQENRTGTRRW
jgi:hypothetical protein